MINQKPLVSIVILHFNRIDDLKETIKRTLEINYRNLEYIIVDNGSKKEIKSEFKKINNQKIKKIIINKNKGSAYGHTVGMKKANGKYILTIDDDSFVSINSINVLVELFESNKNLGAVGLGMLNPITNFNLLEYKSKINFNVNSYDLKNSYQSIIATSAAFFRSKCLKEVNYYDLNWNWYTEDTELALKIIQRGYNTINIPEIIAYHKSSLVNRNFDLMLKNSIEGTILLYFKFYPFIEALFNFFKILLNSLINSIYNFKMKYFIYALVSPQKIINVIIKKKVIKKEIRKNIHIPGNAIFSRK